MISFLGASQTVSVAPVTDILFLQVDRFTQFTLLDAGVFHQAEDEIGGALGAPISGIVALLAVVVALAADVCFL